MGKSGGLVALWCSGWGKTEEGRRGLLIGLEVEQKEQGIAGIYHGGAISGEAPFPAREERKVTSRGVCWR